MTAGLQGERGGQVQSDVGEGALQGGHAVSVGQRPALHDGQDMLLVLQMGSYLLHPVVWKEGGVFNGPAIFTSWDLF